MQPQTARTGALWIVAATLLNILPWFGGPGWIWSAALLTGGAWLATERAPLQFGVIYTLAGVAHALDNFYFGLGTLPWLVGAVMLVRSISSQFDFARLRGGYTLYVAGGAVVGLGSLFWTWGERVGYYGSSWMGGLDLKHQISPVTGDSSLGLQYNATKWLMPMYSPGFEWTGQMQSGAFNETLLMLTLGGWAIWRDDAVRSRFRVAALVAGIWNFVWAIPSLDGQYNGPFVWAICAGAMIFGVWKIGRGVESGPLDPGDVARRVRARMDERRDSST